ncbi:MAG TPA: hypothetical protein PKV27_09175 [Ilumatobacteraceae bacterium]|nr:hypothetical protein [Ilumatobacteraceae bacterium]
METLFGLPAHPLLVHLPVVIIPLAALATLMTLIRRSWLDRYGWWLLGLSGVGMLGAVLAASSGEELESKVEESALLERHAELGDTARLMGIIFFVVVAVVVLGRYFLRRNESNLGRWLRGSVGALVCALVITLSGAGATYAVVQAGHQGAKVTWNDVKDEAPAGDQGGVTTTTDD